jgi:serine/threonine protein phosphatase PrpC
MITCFPEVRMHRITPDLKFLFLACDGIWDCMTSQECANHLNERMNLMKPTERLSGIVGELFDRILAVNVMSSAGIGTDNMTAVLVKFTG